MVDNYSSHSSKSTKHTLNRKESKLNIALKKLTDSICYKNEKKQTHKDRKCSFHMLFHFFRSPNNAYVNDAAFQIKNYNQQKIMKDSLSLVSIYSHDGEKLERETVSIKSQYLYNKPNPFPQRPPVRWGLSSDMSVHSEDLTAKEFANIAGIRIVPEDDLGELKIPQQVHKSSHSVHLMDHIWDARFWKHPNNQLGLMPYTIEPPPILDELKRHKKNISEGAYIKRGRFEIHLFADSPHII